MPKGDDIKYKKEYKNSFNGIVKLASSLQKTLETGRTNYVEMSEVSRYLSYYVKTQIDDSYMYMDYIVNNYKTNGDFRRLCDDITSVFDDINKIIVNGYEKLLAPNGSVNTELLEQLIRVDTEITTALGTIRSVLLNINSHGYITEEEIKNITEMLNELVLNVSERRKIIK